MWLQLLTLFITGIFYKSFAEKTTNSTKKKFKILCTIIQITIMQSQPHAYNCFIKWFVNIFECWHSCNCHSLCHHKVWTTALKFIFCTFPMWKYFLFCPCNHMVVYTQWKSGKWYVLNDSDILFKYYKYICHYTHQKCISYNLIFFSIFFP